MATCAVSGSLTDATGTAALSVTVSARVSEPVLIGNSLVTPYSSSVSVDSSGNFTITLQQSLSVIFTISYPIVGTESLRSFTYTGNIPATTTASFSTVIVVE